jgi:indolepyruvate ferredoxin oxidoreductase alpha subunit
MEKLLMSGNEAIARGAYESGVVLASAYPGTPSTEILQELTKYPDIYAQWCPNEKVATEVAAGAAYAGARSLAAMKHVGVNVAADPIFTLAYTGVRGGMVIVTADDPELHSSQNEQDNRNYARAAKIPMLEPSDSQEAKDFTKLAFKISEDFDTPVFIRSLTRISHSKSVVQTGEVERGSVSMEVIKDAPKLVMLPANARRRHPILEERIIKLREYSNNFAENRIELNNPEFGIITAGIGYQYAKEVFPDYSFLKLAMIHPLPDKIIREFASKVKNIYVLEELDPFIEEQAMAMGIEVTGKKVFPMCGEFDPTLVERAVRSDQGDPVEASDIQPVEGLPPRPPNMCPGCPHRSLYYTLKKMKVFVAADIGCYTLAFLPPLQTVDTCLCMGAGIGHAVGMEQALKENAHGKVVAVIGDSTFFHSGITSLMNMAWNKVNSTIIILDNRTTAMTGFQPNPGSGSTLMGSESIPVDIPMLCKALGIERVSVIDPYNLEETKKVLKEEIEAEAPSVVISRAPCTLLPEYRQLKNPPYSVDAEKCKGCKTCVKLGCPAIEWQVIEPASEKRKKDQGKSFINTDICSGCGVCAQLCKVKAIEVASDA